MPLLGVSAGFPVGHPQPVVMTDGSRGCAHANAAARRPVSICSVRVVAALLLAGLGMLVGTNGAGATTRSGEDGAARGGMGPTWSPDGRRLAFLGPSPDPATGRGFGRVLVATPAGRSITEVASAPDDYPLGDVRWVTEKVLVYQVSDSNVLFSVR